jgi:transposase InsO family protein
MDGRRLVAQRVLMEGWSVSAAAREAGVCRTTAHLWIARAKEVGIGGLAEVSRRPHQSPSRTAQSLEGELLELKAKYPSFGARKLSAILEGRIPARTAARILFRHGLTCAPSPAKENLRFERGGCNELWQMDFKGMRQRRPLYDPLSIVDDSSRFAIALKALPNQQLGPLWDCLWAAFEVYGLPDATLSDNGPVFRNNGTWRPSKLDLRLALLGIQSLHGRPYHPQTQGKVERFHGTIARTLGKSLWQPTLEDGQRVLSEFRDLYNWERPHEAIDLKVPGAVYKRSLRERPATLPEPEFPPDCVILRVTDQATLRYQGNTYRMGKALIREPVGLLQQPEGILVYYHSQPLGYLYEYAL